MIKARKKSISLLVALVFLLSIMLPTGTAFGATTYEAITAIPEFDPATDAAAALDLSQIHVKVDPATNTFSSALIEVVDSGGSLLKINSVTPSVYAGTCSSDPVDPDRKTWKFKATTQPDPNGKWWATLSIEVDAKNCAAGDIQVRFSNPTGQFVAGEVVAAKATGAAVTAAVLTKPAFGDSGGETKIRLSETVAGGIKAVEDTVKFKLPAGFEWRDPEYNVVAGSGAFEFTVDGRDLKIKRTDTPSEKTIVDITAKIDVDPTLAKVGDVTVTVSGESNVSPSELVVATYGEYQATLSSVSVKAVEPGQLDQEIGKFAIKELLPGTLVEGRTITLTLPEKAKWMEDPGIKISTGDSKLHGFDLTDFQVIGTDKRTVKATVYSASSGTKSTEIVLKGGKITVAADFTGDIELVVGGSAGVSGRVKVAEVKPLVTAEASGKPKVIIGLQAQAAADITLIESKAEALKAKYDTPEKTSGDAYLRIETPPGVRFAAAPTFTVTEGDLQLGTVITDSDWAMVRVESTSSKASTVRISGIKLTVDRTVPEGDIKLKIGGPALVENDIEPYFRDVKWAAKVAVANCVTPAPVEVVAQEATFVIGSTAYTVNGVAQEMDVAPYIKEGRTFIPVRYAARACGVDEHNIIWDGVNRTVTLMKGDRVVQMKIGSKTMLINGASITMDVAPEIVAPGRTMLPFRFVAQALGAKVDWDAATQTVTMKL